MGVLVGAGALVAVPAGAASAKPKCAIGNWKLIKAKATEKLVVPEDGPFSYVQSGYSGTKLKVTAKSWTYNYKGSKTGTTILTERGTTREVRRLYKGTVTLPLKLSGDRKGTFSVNEDKAKGKATGYAKVIRPRRGALQTFNLIKVLHNPYGNGGFDPIPAGAGRFTCSATTLKARTSITVEGSYVHTLNLVFTRL
ncbi:hypothetical protein GCM10027589_27780 [Actinocorallia lasiicapitis]